MTDDVEHKPLPVSGYTPQSKATVDLVNRNKELEERLLRVLDELEFNPMYNVDICWLKVGRRHIEQGFMEINRAIFKPQRFNLPVQDSDNGQENKS